MKPSVCLHIAIVVFHYFGINEDWVLVAQLLRIVLADKGH